MNVERTLAEVCVHLTKDIAGLIIDYMCLFKVARHSSYLRHDKSIKKMSAVSNVLMTCSIDKTVRIGNEVPLIIKVGAVLAMAALRDGFVACACQSTIRVWDTQTGVLARSYVGHTSWIWVLVLLKNGQLASGSDDTTVRIWDTQPRKPRSLSCIHELKGHNDSVYAIAELKNDKLATGGKDLTVRVWDMNTWSCRLVILGHSATITSLCSLSNGNVASASHDNTVSVWDADTGVCIRKFECKDWVKTIVEFTEGVLVSGGSDGVYVHDILNNTYTHALFESVNDLIVIDDKLATCSSSGVVHYWT